MVSIYYVKYCLPVAFIVLMYTVIPNIKNHENYIGKLNNTGIKYALVWTSRKFAPFDSLQLGRLSFKQNNCRYTNCFLTDNRNFLHDIREFDAILFNGRGVDELTINDLPQVRDTRQKYIFAAMESAHNYPVCNDIFDSYFNWTWTYKLDSDFRWGYITIYDLNGTIVGPAMNMHWPKLKPIDNEVKAKLENKNKAAAWFVSNCRTLSKREPFAHDVRLELRKYGWELDIFGACGRYDCPRSTAAKCFKMLELDYFFYMSFENSFSVDYVTEKLLNALNNYVVPVVYGGANYSRFLPPGSYLNARELGVAKLAKYMDRIMRNQRLYYKFHRWRNHFVYKATAGNTDMCTLCEMLNDKQKMSECSLHENLRDWWNGQPLTEACIKNRKHNEFLI